MAEPSQRGVSQWQMTKRFLMVQESKERATASHVS
jgi:hypothetical protein